MYTVFNKTINKVEHGARLLRTYFKSKNARQVYIELRQHYKYAAVGQYTRTTLIGELDLHITDWTGSHEKFFTRWNDKWKQLEDLEPGFAADSMKRVYLQKVLQGHGSYKDIFEQEETAVRVAIQFGTCGMTELVFEHFWIICLNRAKKVDIEANQMAINYGKKRRVFTADTTNTNSCQEMVVNKMTQLERRRGAITPDDEKLPAYIWNELGNFKNDRRFWRQISSESKRKIVSAIPPGEPTSNPQIMGNLAHILINEVVTSEDAQEDDLVQDSDDSSDSDDTRAPEYRAYKHDVRINQARQSNKGDSKLELASELSPGHLARVMSSKEGREKTREQELKSQNAQTKSYKTQCSWALG